MRLVRNNSNAGRFGAVKCLLASIHINTEHAENVKYLIKYPSHGLPSGETPTKKRPSGGSGGAGGDVYAIADSALETLDSQLHHVNGKPGGPGGGGQTPGDGRESTLLRGIESRVLWHGVGRPFPRSGSLECVSCCTSTAL